MSMISVRHGIWLLKNSTVQNIILYIFERFSANTTVQNGTYMVEMVRFSENCTVLSGTVYGSSRPRYTHGKPYGGKNRGKQPRENYRVEPWIFSCPADHVVPDHWQPRLK